MVERLILRCLGILFIQAFFLYENERGELENRIEEMWIRIDDYRQNALSRQVGFFRETSKVTDSIINRFLGVRLVSFQAIAVCMTYSLASMELFNGIALRHYRQGSGLLVFGLRLLLLGSIPALLAGRSRRLRTISCIPAVCYTVYLGLLLVLTAPGGELLVAPLALLLGMVSDFGFI